MKRSGSVIISSYNYARFLRQAIDSALAQTHPHTQVIVVDDGSTDESPDILRSYGDRISAILKENRGQASSLNAGFGASSGEVIIFLDSDDALEPDAVALAAALMHDNVSKVHWPLRQTGAAGEPGRLIPSLELPAGDLKREVLVHGPRSDRHTWPPTSGNAWSRRYLERVMPMPEAPYRTCPDLYLCALAPLYGCVASTGRPLGFWRVHGENHTWKRSFLDRVGQYVKLWEECCSDLERHARRLGLAPDPEQWRRESWWHRLSSAAEEVRRIVPRDGRFVLIDDDQWACTELDGRTALPLVGSHGCSWGPPADDAQAIAALGHRRDEGATHVVFAWPAFWWLDHYAKLAAHLRARCRCIAEHSEVVVFSL